ncbi:MAG: amidohydrolase [Anaerolineales bacterium]|nr:amidohydrolase [Anaerolineales bacterium]
MSEPYHLSRRDFLKLAAAAAAGLGGTALACRKSAQPLTLPEGSLTRVPLPVETQAAGVFQPGTMADIVLTDGNVMTVDALDSTRQAVAIAGDKILATGASEEMLALAAPGAQQIDLAGRTVTPGLIDTHIHFRGYGLTTTYYTAFNPPEVVDIPGLQAMLAEVLRTKQPGEWLMGYYTALGDKPIPTKEDLDPVSPDNPVFIMHIGGHWGTANSAALKIADVTGKTPSPQGGIIEKKDGDPTGVFYNHRAMDVLRKYAPPITDQLIRESIIQTQQLLARCGLTCFHDNNVRGLEAMQAYQEMSLDGSLYLRNNLYLTLEWPADLDLLDQVQFIQNDLTRFAGYKFLIDGQGPTAYTNQPHNGSEWRLPTWDPQMFKEVVKSLHNTGLQICVHCIGDAASDLVLEAYEEAQNANPRSDPRHRLEHAVLTSSGATRKMKDLGVVPSTQPAFIYLFGDGWKALFGEERMDRIMVTREWLEAGLHLTIGSDAPSTPFFNPQASLAGAQNRLSFKQTPIGADQVLSFNEALRAHTIEGAYAAHQENVLGSLEAGKFADLVVWNQDPSRQSLRDLTLTQSVDLTMVGGKIVHQA